MARKRNYRLDDFYVYAYVRKSDQTPFYIGKGSGKRCIQKHAGISIPNDRFYIRILESNLTEIGAYAIERRMIRWFGRKDKNNGILLNRTDGGEGQTGNILKGVSRTEDVKRKISLSKIGKPSGMKGKTGWKAKLKGDPSIKISDEQKVLISNALKGKKKSQEHRNKIRQAVLNRGPVTNETREKLRQASIKAWKRKKENVSSPANATI